MLADKAEGEIPVLVLRVTDEHEWWTDLAEGGEEEEVLEFSKGEEGKKMEEDLHLNAEPELEGASERSL